jgi:hypothetical protein
VSLGGGRRRAAGNLRRQSEPIFCLVFPSSKLCDYCIERKAIPTKIALCDVTCSYVLGMIYDMLEAHGGSGKVALVHVLKCLVKPGLYFADIHQNLKEC